MKKVVLISCVSKKLDRKAKAGEIYISPLFKYNLRFAKLLNPNKIFILSAEYGLLNLDQEINTWAPKVSSLEREIEDLNKDKQ